MIKLTPKELEHLQSFYIKRYCFPLKDKFPREIMDERETRLTRNFLRSHIDKQLGVFLAWFRELGYQVTYTCWKKSDDFIELNDGLINTYFMTTDNKEFTTEEVLQSIIDQLPEDIFSSTKTV